LLKKLDYSLKANVKKEAGKDHPYRDEQFVYIQMQKQIFQDAGLPAISVDTKKKEQIGNFKNAGQVWCKEADVVNVHDFPQDALGRAERNQSADQLHHRKAPAILRSRMLNHIRIRFDTGLKFSQLGIRFGQRHIEQSQLFDCIIRLGLRCRLGQPAGQPLFSGTDFLFNARDLTGGKPAELFL